MRVVYDSETDTLTITFSDTLVAESDQDKPGTILDYDSLGNLVSIEILDASRRVGLPTQIEYQVVPVTA
jgi:YD repeat-containing protein